MPLRPVATPSPPVWVPPRPRPVASPPRLLGSPPRRPGWFVLVLLLPSLVLGAVCVAARRGYVPPWIAFLYVGMSAVTAIAYALDKFRAQKGAWRISESTLQLFAMAGGWPGALPAQHLLRHKTRKISFQVTFWLIVAAHLAFWVWFARQRLAWWR